MVSAAMSCVKYLLFAFNLIFAISGIAILVVGGICQGVYHNYSEFVDDKFFWIPIVVIVVGAVITIIAFFGCCGAVKENHCMISTFASLLLIIFILELVGGIAVYVLRNDLKKIFDDKIISSVKSYDSNQNVKNTWDILQADFHCCGANGVIDWLNRIPSSCCQNLPTEEQCTVSQAYDTGCLDTLQGFVEKNALILGGVGIGIALIQLIGVIFACCLARSIQKEYESV